MIFDKEIAPYILLEENSVFEALNKINKNQSRILFTVSNSGVIQGVISDGDVRRWLTKQDKIDLNIPVFNIHNKSYKGARIDDPPFVIQKIFSDRINIVPLADQNNRIVAIAKQQSDFFEIGGYKVGKDHPVFIIAEIGNNHNGDFDLAKKNG